MCHKEEVKESKQGRQCAIVGNRFVQYYECSYIRMEF